MRSGIKHVVQCRCALRQHLRGRDARNFSFIVFSTVDVDETVDVKFTVCPNCGATHKIIDVCKSEILNRDNDDAYVLLRDETLSILPKNVVDAIEIYEPDVATLENIAFVIDEEKWDVAVMLTSAHIDDYVQGKYIVFKGSKDNFVIRQFTRQDVLSV